MPPISFQLAYISVFQLWMAISRGSLGTQRRNGDFFLFCFRHSIQARTSITKFTSWLYIRFLFLAATPGFTKPQILFYSLIRYLYSERNYEMNVVTHLSTICFKKRLNLPVKVTKYIKYQIFIIFIDQYTIHLRHFICTVFYLHIILKAPSYTIYIQLFLVNFHMCL